MQTKQAVILAGGKGTRLASILEGKPKPLAPIAGQTILYYQLKALEKYGFTQVLILVQYQGEQIEAYIKEHKFALECKVVFEPDPRGTAGALVHCYELLQDRFLVVYGDTFFDLDLQRFYNFHEASTALACLLIHPNDHPVDSDLVETDDSNNIIAFHKYPHPTGVYFHNMVNAACYVMNKVILEPWLGTTTMLDFGKDVFPIAIQNNVPLKGYYTAEYIKDCGTPERIAKVEKHYYSGRIAAANINNKQKAIFLDRDGTINKHIDQLNKLEQLELLPQVSEAIKIFNELGYKVLVVTNQPVIARGELTIEGLNTIHKKLEMLLGESGSFVNKVYYCPHHPHAGYDGEISSLKITCTCRKPATDLVSQGIADFNLDIEKSWFVGDTTIDIKTAENASIKSVLVQTGMAGTDQKYPEIQPTLIMKDLITFAHYLRENI
jgi:histidinol-phosphate phosphatase family protein